VRIGLCDDNKECLEKLYQALKTIIVAMPNTSVDFFSSGNELVNQYENCNHYDLLFLDIEMPGLSGIETGHMIRERDSQVNIVFLTSHKQYMSQSLKVEVFDYLLKPLDLDELKLVLERAIKKYKEQHYIIEIRIYDTSYTLEVNEIIYIESDRNHITFHTVKEKYRCIGKLKEYQQKLASYGFLKCHNSILINMQYVKNIENDSIITKTGIVVDMSKRKKRECLRKFSEYILRYKI